MGRATDLEEGNIKRERKDSLGTGQRSFDNIATNERSREGSRLDDIRTFEDSRCHSVMFVCW